MRLVACLLLCVAACQGKFADEPPGEKPVPVAQRASADDEAPVRCAQDADCPRLSCGPCKAGDVVTADRIRVKCYRNPCPGAKAVCRNKVCVVQ